MCGFFGYRGPVDSAVLQRCAQALVHRGPDGQGEFVDAENHVYLGHTRLAIIDLSNRAAQPMSTADGRFTIAFNGEIYNFRRLRTELERLGHTFRTESDTETLLLAYRQWGAGCLERLHGMFAFAVWDRDARSLFLARDRLGIKPLYVYRKGDEWAFASEPKAILALPSFRRKIHPQGLADFLLHGFSSGRETVWEGIERLPPASWAEWRATGEVRSGTYWRLPDAVDHTWTEPRALQRLDELLSEVVAEHLVSDVPIGVLLSGGIDSSIVAEAAVRHQPALQTFSVGFAGHAHNELPEARRIAEFLKTRHHEQELSAADLGDPRDLYDLFDEPLNNSAVRSMHAVSALARQHVKVVLSGDGGDELFGGYQWYRGLRSSRRSLKDWVQRILRLCGLGRRCPYGVAGEAELLRVLRNPSFSVDEICRLFPAVTRQEAEQAEDGLKETLARLAGGARWQRLDLETFLANSNLVYVDRVSMARGLEVRVPLLDHRIVEFAFSLPERIAAGQEGKRLLREHARRVLPVGIADLPKRGFSSPVDGLWSAESARTRLIEGTLVRAGLLDRAMVSRLLEPPAPSNRPLQLNELLLVEHWAERWLNAA